MVKKLKSQIDSAGRKWVECGGCGTGLPAWPEDPKDCKDCGYILGDVQIAEPTTPGESEENESVPEEPESEPTEEESTQEGTEKPTQDIPKKGKGSWLRRKKK